MYLKLYKILLLMCIKYKKYLGNWEWKFWIIWILCKNSLNWLIKIIICEGNLNICYKVEI